MKLRNLIETIAGPTGIKITTTEGIELYKGYKGNYKNEYDELEISKVGFSKEIIPANELNKKPITIIYLNIIVKK